MVSLLSGNDRGVGHQWEVDTGVGHLKVIFKMTESKFLENFYNSLKTNFWKIFTIRQKQFFGKFLQFVKNKFLSGIIKIQIKREISFYNLLLTKLVWNSVRSTLRAPSNRREAVMDETI